jgi:hypothetical protein
MSNDDERDHTEEDFNRTLLERDEAPPTRFIVYGHMLPGIAERFPVSTDHGAVMALNEALFTTEGELCDSAIDGPCDMAAELLADSDGEIDGYRIMIHPAGNVNDPWIAGHIEYVRDRETLPEPDEEGGIYDVAAIIRDAVQAANELLDWYEHGTTPDLEPHPVFECCGNELPRPVPGGPLVLCPDCQTVFTCYDPVPDLARLLATAQRQAQGSAVPDAVNVRAITLIQNLMLPEFTTSAEAEAAIRAALGQDSKQDREGS